MFLHSFSKDKTWLPEACPCSRSWWYSAKWLMIPLVNNGRCYRDVHTNATGPPIFLNVLPIYFTLLALSLLPTYHIVPMCFIASWLPLNIFYLHATNSSLTILSVLHPYKISFPFNFSGLLEKEHLLNSIQFNAVCITERLS